MQGYRKCLDSGLQKKPLIWVIWSPDQGPPPERGAGGLPTGRFPPSQPAGS